MDDDQEGFAPISDALPRIKPLTPVQQRRRDSATAIADDPPEGITFQHTVLTKCLVLLLIAECAQHRIKNGRYR